MVPREEAERGDRAWLHAEFWRQKDRRQKVAQKQLAKERLQKRLGGENETLRTGRSFKELQWVLLAGILKCA